MNQRYKKPISLVLLLTVLFSLVSSAVAAKQGVPDYSNPAAFAIASKTRSDTKEQVLQQLKEKETQVANRIKDETKQNKEMIWTQLPAEKGKKIASLFQRKTIQLASYFYTDLHQLLTEAEVNKTYQWDDEDVMKQIEQLPADQQALLAEYTPAAACAYETWKQMQAQKQHKKQTDKQDKSQATDAAASQAEESIDQVVENVVTDPSELQYTEENQKFTYLRNTVENPVDELYHTANILETDLVLKGKNGMDLVLQRRYNSLDSKITSPGLASLTENKTYLSARGQEIDFANGWKFNVPEFVKVDKIIDAIRDEIDSDDDEWVYRLEEEDVSDRTYRIRLDDWTYLDGDGALGWRNYPYYGINIWDRFNAARLEINGITYVYKYDTLNRDILSVTKINQQGDQIVYRWPDNGDGPVEIVDTIGRLVVLEEDPELGVITDVKVYADETKQTLLKHLHYDIQKVEDGPEYYYQLNRVQEVPVNVDQGTSPKTVASYTYFDPNLHGRAPFNMIKDYRLPEVRGKEVIDYLDENGQAVESSEYVRRDDNSNRRIKYLLLQQAQYPVQGLTLHYRYSSYNASEPNPWKRGVVRLYQDSHALSYVSYHPVTKFSYSYTPMRPNPVDPDEPVTETFYHRTYNSVSTEMWQVPKAEIPRLAEVVGRDGDKVVREERPTGSSAYLFERTYQVNEDGNPLLRLVKKKASSGGFSSTESGKEYHYVDVGYTSYAYRDDDIKPTYAYQFLEGVGNQEVYQYLLWPEVDQRSHVDSSQLAKYANETEYTYNDYGDATSETDPLNNKTTWTYDTSISWDRLLLEKVRMSADQTIKQREQYTYNPTTRLIKTETISAAYPGLEGTDQIKREYTYDANTPTLLRSIRETISGADGTKEKVSQLTHDEKGLHVTNLSMEVETSPDRMRTIQLGFRYDALDRLVSQTYPDGSRAEYSYDLLDRITSDKFVTSERQTRRTTYNYVDSLRLVMKHLPDDSYLATIYTPFGDVEYVEQIGTDRQKRPLLYNTYTIDGKHLSETFPYASEERKTRYYYRSDGSVWFEVNPRGITEYRRANAETDPAAGSYLPVSAEQATYPNGLQTYSYLDRYGRLETEVAQTLVGERKQKSTYQRNPFGYPVQKEVSDQENQTRVWKYLHDLRGNVVALTDPEQNEYAYHYDALGNLLHVYENGQLTRTQQFNTLSWKLKEKNAADQEEFFGYTVTGDLEVYKDKAGNRHWYQYTPFYELERLYIFGTSGEVDYWENKTYDPDSRNLLEDTNSYGHTITYGYDGFHRMNQFTTFGRTYQVHYQTADGEIDPANINDLDDLVDRLVYPDGTTVRYNYDNQERLASVTSPLTGTITYQYTIDTTGETDTVTYPGGSYNKRTITPFGEVEQVQHSTGWTESLRHDGFGNIVSKETNGRQSVFGYDRVNRLVEEQTPSDSKAYTYDARGNRETHSLSTAGAEASEIAEIAEPSGTFTYDVLNRLRTFAGEDGTNAAYTYYSGGLRATKDVNGEMTRYVYLNGRVIEELDGEGNVKARTIWGNQLLYRQDETANKGGYYEHNSHGDVVAIRDASGNTLNQYEYDVWGNVIDATEGMSNPFQYSGEIYDEETKLYYLRARYYDPSVGRFITEDTYKGQVDNPLSLNRYTYGHNNPLRFIDPSGHSIADAHGNGGWNKQSIEQLMNDVISGRVSYDSLASDQKAMLKAYSDNLKRQAVKDYWFSDTVTGFATGFTLGVEAIEVAGAINAARALTPKTNQVNPTKFVPTPATNKQLADSIAQKFGGTVQTAKGDGWAVKIPVTLNGKQDVISLRVMNSSKYNDNYWRLSIGSKGTVDINGNFSNEIKPTHINITENSFDDISRIIERFINP
ncbi:hypothetical protein LOK74_20960 [Brevibacillus humidisoli]|uniref:RHS repeat domain-containing protein n=1 Tax=Brevibacillus humidisoli TaxID=2895522 RepID=UPI001E42368D|nr:RHS repeat-associated core domain-containing protein [Brevibacillus humidisoli]UFJ40473.1 hypothetical protein LOK74_20960 [Brevibacillus humidisoli]